MQNLYLASRRMKTLFNHQYQICDIFLCWPLPAVTKEANTYLTPLIKSQDIPLPSIHGNTVKLNYYNETLKVYIQVFLGRDHAYLSDVHREKSYSRIKFRDIKFRYFYLIKATDTLDVTIYDTMGALETSIGSAI